MRDELTALIQSNPDSRELKRAIAEAIGSTRVTVTRLLGDLCTDAMISIHKKKITVHNLC